jgi:hypothetical protein
LHIQGRARTASWALTSGSPHSSGSSASVCPPAAAAMMAVIPSCEQWQADIYTSEMCCSAAGVLHTESHPLSRLRQLAREVDALYC